MQPTPQVTSLRSLISLFLVSACVLPMASGCALAPSPIVLLNKPHVSDAKASNGKRICLIVKDERPEIIQKINMCGVTRSTIFLIPTSFAFLAHPEHLDAIVAHHVKKNLQHQGFDVIRSYPPAPDELSQQRRAAKDISDEDRKAAWAVRDTQDDKGSRKKSAKSGVEDLEEEFVSAWGPNVDVSDSDAIVEVRIRKYWTDYNYWGSFSWCSMSIAVCDPHDPVRRVVFGKKARGIAYYFGILTPLTPQADVPVSVGVAHWFVMHAVEKIAGSEAFSRAMNELGHRDQES